VGSASDAAGDPAAAAAHEAAAAAPPDDEAEADIGGDETEGEGAEQRAGKGGGRG